MQTMKSKSKQFQYYCHEIISQNKKIMDSQEALDFIRSFDTKTEYHQDLFNQVALVLMATKENPTIDEKINRIDTCMMFFEAMGYSGLQVLLLAVMNDFKEELKKKSSLLHQTSGLTKQ